MGTRTLSVKISQTGPGWCTYIFRAGLFFTARAIFQSHLPCVVYRICKRPKHISMMGHGEMWFVHTYIYLCARMIIFILCCSTRACNTWHHPIPLSNISLSLSLYLSLYFFLIFVLVHLLTLFLFLSSSFFVAFSSSFFLSIYLRFQFFLQGQRQGIFVCNLFKNHIPLRSWFFCRQRETLTKTYLQLIAEFRKVRNSETSASKAKKRLYDENILESKILSQRPFR